MNKLPNSPNLIMNLFDLFLIETLLCLLVFVLFAFMAKLGKVMEVRHSKLLYQFWVPVQRWSLWTIFLLLLNLLYFWLRFALNRVRPIQALLLCKFEWRENNLVSGRRQFYSPIHKLQLVCCRLKFNELVSCKLLFCRVCLLDSFYLAALV